MTKDINEQARLIVVCYIFAHLCNPCETQIIQTSVDLMGNSRWQMSAALEDGQKYRFDVAYNEARNEFCLDAYKHFENRYITV